MSSYYFIIIFLAIWLSRPPILVVTESYFDKQKKATNKRNILFYRVFLVFCLICVTPTKVPPDVLIELKKVREWLLLRIIYLNSQEVRSITLLVLVSFVAFCCKYPNEFDPIFQFILCAYFVILEGVICIASESVNNAILKGKPSLFLITLIVFEIPVVPPRVTLPVPTPPPKHYLQTAFA